ncbi:unnamed protein product [Albugo candida]|uniref:threonine--tRNA ligase n=1 Tax=Albugo candida TaxID=65357 RepID=A0A024G2S3_9STRA|nr:unnamed protein product [Albugo candida]|eukprot:CCI40847.1 unnamed protein product [Albugo candida]
MWELECKRQQKERKNISEAISIEVHTKHGVQSVCAVANTTTPLDILKQSDERQLLICEDPVLGAQYTYNNNDGTLHNTLHDLNQPLSHSGKLNFLNFDSAQGKQIFWHSSAHVMGQALESRYHDQIRLCDGPALIDGGFFYETFFDNQYTISESDFKELEAICKRIVKERQPFERMEVTRDFARELFAYSDFKLQMLQNIPPNEVISLYRCGRLIDLCRGPHVPHTGLLKAFRITRCGASHWKNQALLQRIYGISFPTKAEMKSWQHFQVEAAKRDHRIIGKQQQLFFFHPYSPGSAFFLPHGARIFNKLSTLVREEYKLCGYEEVITPLIFKKELWKTSGHWDNYKENIFMIAHDHADDQHPDAASLPNNMVSIEQLGLKPMNCPGHCLIFREGSRYSYRDLPVRFADFSSLHRNEATGALTGLTRVRRFHQDDAHIFCRDDQVQQEIADCLAFIKRIYGIFGFKFELCLSTRPEKYLGDLSLWETAERQLEQALNDFKQPWTIKEGDGAFYGPKIDLIVTDALKRQHQCGTIQLDFQLPRKFDLVYDGADGQTHSPIIVHRAVLGSIERMMAILIEHTGGKWPLWINPRQVAIIPVAAPFENYANSVATRLRKESMLEYVDVLECSKTLSKRVREAQLAQYSFILIVGDKEQQHEEINVRTRDNEVCGAQSIFTFIQNINALIHQKK